MEKFPLSSTAGIAEAHRSTALERLELIESAGPVGAKQAGEAAVGEELAAGLARGAVVGFVVGVADALDGRATTRAGLAEAGVYRHLRAKGCDVLREFFPGFGGEPVDP